MKLLSVFAIFASNTHRSGKVDFSQMIKKLPEFKKKTKNQYISYAN